jgi:hypothetical protein
MDEHKEALIGKTITKVWLAKDRLAIKFDLEDEEPVVAYCDADCCSYTWIESIDLPGVLLGTVRDTEDLPYGEREEPGEDSYEYIQHYGFAITTEKGKCVIDYRNSSNGYYGGWLHWPGHWRGTPYGGVFGQNKSELEWEEIHE